MSKLEKNGVVVYFKDITPSLAVDLLKKNEINRKLDKNRVEKYLEDMEKGFWCFNGDAIRFDKKGMLADGQHRLTAISRQDRTFTFLIIENVDDESKRTIDTGKSRTGGDVLSIFSGVKSSAAYAISSAITKMILYKKGLSLTSGGGNAKHFTNSHIDEFYKTNYIKLMESFNFIESKYSRGATLIPKGDALFLHFIFSEINRSDADEFMAKVLTGSGISDRSNEFMLRNILIRKSRKQAKISPAEVLYTAIKAWNRTRKGGVYSTESNLKYNTNDNGYPLAI
jgi:hypothetical protein